MSETVEPKVVSEIAPEQNQGDEKNHTPAEDLIDIEHFMKVKLRVGRIEQVELVPKSKKLYKLQVYLGEELGRRQILSGIAQHYSPESLENKKIIVVANLKPAKLMGHESHGMLLASSPADNSRVILADPGDAEPGDVVR